MHPLNMDTLKYNDNIQNSQFTNWEATPTSLSTDSSKTTNQKPKSLHVVYKQEALSCRPIIPATIYEKLAFYRAYVSSPSKSQIICTRQGQFNRFLWFHVMNVFFKSLPNAYVYMFLSAYAPDQHLYLSKMIPLAYGANWAFVLAAFIYLVTYTDTITFLLDYVICGFIFKNPWNRCPSKFIKYGDTVARCYSIEDFSSKLQNETLLFVDGLYKSSKNMSFQLAPIVYYSQRFQELSNVYLYFAFLWIVAAFHYKQMYHRFVWRMLHTVQSMVNTLYVICFGHLIITYFDTDIKNVQVPFDEFSRLLWAADMDVLSESMTAPPIVHVITSRSSTKTDPDRDSIAMIVSNSIYYIFRGLLGYRLKIHCEHIVKSPILLSEFNPNSFLYLWPIYFSSFYLGNIYTLLFFTLSFSMEFLTVIISMQCLIETIVFEWKWARREIVTIILCVFGIVYNVTTQFKVRVLLFIYSISVVTTFEVLIIYCLYPLGRLVDDITFFQGVAPTKFRVLNFRVVPIYYLIKMYEMFKGFFEVFRLTTFGRQLPYYVELLYLMWSPFVLGAIYAGYKYVFVKKKTIKSLIKPIPEWGPKNHETRQLRKLYDSRYYVGSQASRKLSRYVIQKSCLESYKLDILYDSYPGASTLTLSEMRTEDEKKHK